MLRKRVEKPSSYLGAPFSAAPSASAPLASVPAVGPDGELVSDVLPETGKNGPVSGRLLDQDEELKLQFLAGSTEAFIRLYAKYEVALLLYCRRMLRDDQAAEDAFQDIWARIYELRNRKSTTGEDFEIGHFRGLLFQSARNMCFNVLRTQHPHSSEELEPLSIDERSSREATQREIQELMVKALTKLPFDQREIFVLHEYSGFSYAEIAEMMESNEASVKVRAYRARLRLRKFIQGWLGLAESDDPSQYI